jgi:hypothetical protein
LSPPSPLSLSRRSRRPVGAADTPPKVGQPAPAFSAVDLDGKTRSLSEFKGKYVVLEWHNQSCPFVKKHYESRQHAEAAAGADREGRRMAQHHLVGARRAGLRHP